MMLKVLRVYRKNYPSKDFVFKRFDANEPIDTDFVRARFKEMLFKCNLIQPFRPTISAILTQHICLRQERTYKPFSRDWDIRTSKLRWFAFMWLK